MTPHASAAEDANFWHRFAIHDGPRPMACGIAATEEAGAEAGPTHPLIPDRRGILSLLMASAWCGLFAGLLEVGAIVLRKWTFDINRFYWVSRDFSWLIPTLDLAIFVVAGLLLSALVLCAPRRGGWLAVRLLATLTLLPPIWAAFPRIYGPAGFFLALGLAMRLVPWIERRPASFRRLVRWTFPAMAIVVLALAGSVRGRDWIKTGPETAPPLPATGRPNVLLVVLDTVGADHLSLYGYDRPTSLTLDDLAPRGIRFDRAQAASSWTLPSHASLFTGRWPHEVSAGWFTPLDATFPTLAGYLEKHGYATAGFVANYWYCGYDSGLARGFTEYRDHRFPRLTALKTAVLVHRPMEGLQAIEQALEDWLDFDLLKPAADQLWWLLESNRKETAEVNGEFLEWLSRRREPERPFFAFLNYFDAHYPYEIPRRGLHRFGSRPRNRRESLVLRDWLRLAQENPSRHQIDFARDAYDDCVADLDEQIGCLIDELEHRSLLERTWVIVTADHGESFGEHPGEFWHGTSLHEAQVHVPLLIIPPAGTVSPSRRVITEAVSLRNLASTIVDVVGLRDDSPFPGPSLAGLWKAAAPATPEGMGSEPTLSEVVALGSLDPDPAQWLRRPRWPSAALTDGEWKYIRREGDVREELFHTRVDTREQRNVAADPAMRPMLERMRAALFRLTAGPLTPGRFAP